MQIRFRMSTLVPIKVACLTGAGQPAVFDQVSRTDGKGEFSGILHLSAREPIGVETLSSRTGRFRPGSCGPAAIYVLAMRGIGISE